MENKNQWYIVRAKDAGVFFAHIAERRGSEADLTDARCLWYWSGALSLLEMAESGVSRPNNCKFTVTIPSLTVLDVIEIVPCSDVAVKSISEVPAWKE